MAILSIITICINLFVILKNRVNVPLKIIEEQLKKDNNLIN